MSSSGLEKHNEVFEENNRRPWGSYIVFVLSCLLGIVTITGPFSALTIYLKHSGQAEMDAAQILLIIASTTSWIFLGLYVMAARRNEVVGLVRPPVKRWHNACFVTLRFNLIIWLSATVTCLVAAFKQACSISKCLCTLQRLEAGLSISAFVMSIVILSLVEKCNRPFQTPFARKLRPRLVCRVSAFAEDLAFERSVSRGSAFDEKRPTSGEWIRPESKPQLSCERMPIGNLSQCTIEGYQFGTSQTTLSEKQDRPRTHKLGRKQRSADNIKNNPYEYHAMSKYTDSNSSLSSGQTLISSNASVPRRTVSTSSISSVSCANESCASFESNGIRRVTPSSSISDMSHRSPLSVMRTAACPEIPIQPDLRFFPVRRIASAQDLHGAYRPPTIMLQRPRPAVSHYSLRHHSTITAPLSIRKPRLPPRLSSQTSLRPLTSSSSSSLSILSTASTEVSKSSTSKSKRKTIDVKVPGAFINPTSQEQALDAHTRMIEEAILASAKSIKMSRHQPRALDVSKPASTPPEGPPPPLPQHVRKASDDIGRFGARSRLERRGGDDETHNVVKPYVSVVSDRSPTIPILDLDGGRFW